MDPVTRDLIALSDEAFGRLMRRIEDLGDEEYFWEPAPNAWSLRPGRDGRLNMQFGLVFDEVPPMTTIAWRLTHIIDLLSEERCATWVGLEAEPENLFEGGAPATAAAARDLLQQSDARWNRYVGAVDVSTLFEPLGPIGRQFAASSRFLFILHIIDELIHHAAEVGVLRDLFRAGADAEQDTAMAALLGGAVDGLDGATIDAVRQAHPQLILTAAETARWGAIPKLIELGFDITGRNGRTPLHHAAAAGEVELVQTLVELGASTSDRDSVFKATPAEWADFFHQSETAALLRSAPS